MFNQFNFFNDINQTKFCKSQFWKLMNTIGPAKISCVLNNTKYSRIDHSSTAWAIGWSDNDRGNRLIPTRFPRKIVTVGGSVQSTISIRDIKAKLGNLRQFTPCPCRRGSGTTKHERSLLSYNYYKNLVSQC